jgi:electron transfer flavoprotein alpha/beta subunit
MKLLTALVPAVLIVGLMGCNQAYPSMRQASDACEEWKEQYDLDESGLKVSKQRWCQLEEETKQILGQEKGEVVKHFRY